MAEIIRTYSENLPALRFIGKSYTEADRKNGSFSHIWDEWFSQNLFAPLNKLKPAEGVENGSLGLMSSGGCANGQFTYCIGMFLPAGTPVPEGYEFIDFEAGKIGVCWIKGKSGDGSIYAMHEACVGKFVNNAMGEFKQFEREGTVFFERYNYPRFAVPDECGDVILDYCVYLKD